MELKDVRIGSRILYNSNRLVNEGDVYEATILEFSPSMKRVKLKYPRVTRWKDVREWVEEHTILEVLEG